MMSRLFPGLTLVLAACPDPGDSTTDTTGTSVTTVPISAGTTAGGTATDATTGAPTGDPPGTTAADTTFDPSTTATTTPSPTTETPDPTMTSGTTTPDPTPGTTTTPPDTTTDPPDCSDQPANPAGPEVVIAPEFAMAYSTYDLGQVPGIPPEARLGGCVISLDDPNALLIAGFSEATNGAIYKVGVERGECEHIVAFSGTAEIVASTPYIDANLLYVQSGLLFYPEWPVNNLSQLLPGGNAPARTESMAAIGVAQSISGIGFVPPGFADAGGMRALSWGGGQWYHLTRTPDADLFVVNNAVQTATLPGGPGGFAYVPAGSPGFAVEHVIVAEWSVNTVGVYQVDDQGDPQERTRKDFFTAFPRPWGAYFEPQTGDYLFLTWGAAMDRVYIVQGFKPPPPIPG
jgi:hypothetical protein